MAGVGVLYVTALFAAVAVAIEGSITGICAFKHAGPFFERGFGAFTSVFRLARLLITLVAAENGFLDLTAIATRIDSDFAGATQTLVAWPRAVVFAAWHHVIANLTTAPAIFVVSIDAASCGFLLATEAYLSRTHVRARRTRTGVTSKLTWVWTFPNSFLSAAVSAGMGRQARLGPRLHLFLAPTGVVLGQHILW